jgi:hypothetical protein
MVDEAKVLLAEAVGPILLANVLEAVEASLEDHRGGLDEIEVDGAELDNARALGGQSQQRQQQK